MHVPRMVPRLMPPVVASAGALTLLLSLSGCSSSSTAPSTTAHSATAFGPDCRLLSTSAVKAMMGTTVESPRSQVQGPATVCTYRAADPAQSVIIRYDSGVNETSFASDRAIFTSKGYHVGQILGLGDEAYYATTSPADHTVNTVVVRQGSDQVLVTGTATLSRAAALARKAAMDVVHATPSPTSTTG
ncbi:MAG: hypothetical protein ACLQPH_22160 [Acidimicrobiales bacterium]